MANKLKLVAEDLQSTHIFGPISEIKKFIDFRRAFFFQTELWNYHYGIAIWYVDANEEFMEAWNLWENIHNT